MLFDSLLSQSLQTLQKYFPRMRLPDWSKALSSSRRWLALTALPFEPRDVAATAPAIDDEESDSCDEDDDDDTIDADEYEDEDEEDSFDCATSMPVASGGASRPLWHRSDMHTFPTGCRAPQTMQSISLTAYGSSFWSHS